MHSHTVKHQECSSNLLVLTLKLSVYVILGIVCEVYILLIQREKLNKRHKTHGHQQQDMSRVLGIGTDIVYLPRFARLISKYGQNSSKASLTRLTSKFMSEHEQKKVLGMMVKGHSTGNNDSIVRYAAGVWATKEAAYKALCSYVPAAAMPPAKTIYTKLLNKTNSETGTPTLELRGDFLQIYPEYSAFYKSYIQEHCNVFISISHDHDYLISYVQITN